MNPLGEVQVNKLRTHTHTVTLVAWSVCMHVVVPHRARNRRKNLTLSQQGMEAGCLQVPHLPVPTCSNDFQCETSVTRRIHPNPALCICKGKYMLEQNAYETVEQHMRVIEKQMPQRTGRTQFNVRDVPAVSWQMLKPSTMNN